MRILGVDPGLTRCGVGVIDASANRSLSFIHVEVIQTSKDLEVPERLLYVQNRLRQIIDEYKPERIAVERVFAQQNLRTVMGTAQASAVVFLEAQTRLLPLDLHTPSEVKAAVTGNGRANKNQVASMVARLLKLPERSYFPDETDALALAICNAWRGRPSSTGTRTLTRAQQQWRAAESQAKKRANKT